MQCHCRYTTSIFCLKSTAVWLYVHSHGLHKASVSRSSIRNPFFQTKETTRATSVYKDVLLANRRDVRMGSGILLWPFTKWNCRIGGAQLNRCILVVVSSMPPSWLWRGETGGMTKQIKYGKTERQTKRERGSRRIWLVGSRREEASLLKGTYCLALPWLWLFLQRLTAAR